MATTALASGEGTIRTLRERIIASVFSFGGGGIIRDDSDRRKTIRDDITRRLRKACSYLSDEEFAALVEKMVKTQIGGEKSSR